LAENFRSELHLEWQGQLSDLVTAVVCSPNGHGWAASSAAGEVVWNAGLGELVVLQAADDRFSTGEEIAFSADSRWLAAGGQAGQLLIWNCDDPDLPPQLVCTVDCGKWIEHLVWHPTDPELAVSCGAHIKIWDVLTSTEIVTWKFDKSSIFDLAWHPAGEYLAVAGYKGLQIWSPRHSNAPKHRIDVDTASINIAWASDGRYLAAGNLDRTLTIVDWHNPDDSWILQGCPGKIRRLIWIAGTTTPCLAVASGTTIVIWNLTPDATSWNGRLWEGHQGIVAALAAHPDEPILASGSADGYTCLWSVDGEIEQILTDPIVSGFTTLGWHPDRQYLVTGSQSGSIGLWLIPA
jgi:WD40 repeat protein